jgi:hypothetical protein
MPDLHWLRQPEASMTLTLRAYSPSQAVQSIGSTADFRSIAADYYVLKSYDLSELKLRIRMAIEANLPSLATPTRQSQA